MFDYQEFITETLSRIAVFRHKALWLMIAGNVTVLVVAAIVVSALVQATLRGLYSFGAQRQAIGLWTFCDQHIHLLWLFVLVLPLPKTLLRGNEDIMPWVLTMVFYAGIILFTVALKQWAIRLKKAADRAEETLDFQAPLLKQMAALARQSGSIGTVTGNSNIVNATNTITHILRNAEMQSLSTKLWWPLIAAIGAAALIKALHLS